MSSSEARLREVFDRVEKHIERRWNVPVRLRDVPEGFTGDLDGEQIHVDFDLDIETALFIVVHLFGHTVQWNVSEASRRIAFLRPATWTEDLLAEVVEYECEAASLSLQLLHDIGVRDLDQWVSDFTACDAAYLLHFYRTGEKPPFKSFWREGTPLIEPRPIPEFQPTVWLSRYQGTVV